MTFPKWYKKDGIPKLFHAEPNERGWEPAGGHYDFALGVWIDDEATVPIAELRAEYLAKFGKKPFGGWQAGILRQKIEEAENS